MTICSKNITIKLATSIATFDFRGHSSASLVAYFDTFWKSDPGDGGRFRLLDAVFLLEGFFGGRVVFGPVLIDFP